MWNKSQVERSHVVTVTVDSSQATREKNAPQRLKLACRDPCCISLAHSLIHLFNAFNIHFLITILKAIFLALSLLIKYTVLKFPGSFNSLLLISAYFHVIWISLYRGIKNAFNTHYLNERKKKFEKIFYWIGEMSADYGMMPYGIRFTEKSCNLMHKQSFVNEI